MSQMIINVIMLHLVIVYVVDISGFLESLKTGLSYVLKRDVISLKPIDCSVCMSFWIIGFYCMAFGEISLIASAFIGCVFAFLAPLTEALMTKIIIFYDDIL